MPASPRPNAYYHGLMQASASTTYSVTVRFCRGDVPSPLQSDVANTRVWRPYSGIPRTAFPTEFSRQRFGKNAGG